MQRVVLVTLVFISVYTQKITVEHLKDDLKTLKEIYYESGVGFWHNSYSAFDSVFNNVEHSITEPLTSLEFFRYVAPIVAFTKEGHSFIRPSIATENYLQENHRYFPFIVKIIEKRVYLLNDYKDQKLKGLEIKSINSQPIQELLSAFFSYEPTDGLNNTSKPYWVERRFAIYLSYLFPEAKAYTLEVNGHTEKISGIDGLNYKDYRALHNETRELYPSLIYKKPIELKVNKEQNSAILMLHSLAFREYKQAGINFRNIVDSVFLEIEKHQVSNLILDLRKNEGGQQEAVDYLLSYLIPKHITKYEYVEISERSFKLFDYVIDPEKERKKKGFFRKLDKHFYQHYDGRYIAKEETFKPCKPQTENRFNGQLYVLVGGRTFSGGAAIATLLKNYTNALFIGEETGGGYYGNTSGPRLRLTLPHSKLVIGVPLFKFVFKVFKNDVSLGRGLIPNVYVKHSIKDVLSKVDNELNVAYRLIKKE